MGQHVFCEDILDRLITERLQVGMLAQRDPWGVTTVARTRIIAMEVISGQIS